MIKRHALIVSLVCVFFLIAACGPTPTPTVTPRPPAPTAIPATATAIPPTATAAPPTATRLPPTATLAPPTATPVPATPTPVPPTPTAVPATATRPPSPTVAPDPATGARLWPQKPCIECHGAAAQGDFGPRLAGAGLSFDQVRLRVRTGKGAMPSFPEAQVSDQELQHIYAWLRSLALPTPTPVARATFPTKALYDFWNSVDAVKTASDFAKDLPARQAGDDAGRLTILKQYAADAIQKGQAAVAQGNQAIQDIPVETVRATLRQVIGQVNAVMGLANKALGENSFGQAWPHAAAMVAISRLDAWPLATQAVRDAGLTGTVRVRVTDRAGGAISGAFVTVLTAHTPVGARTDATGRVTIANVAAVPGLQVKAYAAGQVYHEVHAELSPGATVDAQIALPGANAAGQSPAVAEAAIQPAAGAGNATITLRVKATDPQGAGDLAEDQIFALNPDLGMAYILRAVGGDRYETQVALPGLAAGQHTWYFFAVDHECNTSNVLPVRYTVQ